MNTNYHQLQKQVLSIADSIYRNQETISDRVKTAFQSVPRHLFIDRYRNYGETEWIHVTPENQEQHLPKLYADHPLVIFGTDSDFTSNTGTKPVSTISQPSFVLRMLDLLDIKKGHRIFEVGTGSGWNAALLSKLTGDTGLVISSEIIPELAKSAKEKLHQLKFNNVKVIEADAGYGCSDFAPYDRVMFTVGAYDLPKVFYQQVKENGLLLFVLKNKNNSDYLILLRKVQDHFVSEYIMRCGFVPMTGKYNLAKTDKNTTDFQIPITDNTLKMTVYPSDLNSKPANTRFILKRSESTFIWSTH